MVYFAGEEDDVRAHRAFHDMHQRGVRFQVSYHFPSLSQSDRGERVSMSVPVSMFDWQHHTDPKTLLIHACTQVLFVRSA